MKRGVKMFTNDPIADFHRYDSDREDALAKLPKCCLCGEAIQEEKLFDVGGDLYHVECFENEFLKYTEDYE
jgi:hypothetical protein